MEAADEKEEAAAEVVVEASAAEQQVHANQQQKVVRELALEINVRSHQRARPRRRWGG